MSTRRVWRWQSTRHVVREGVGRDGVDASCAEVAVVSLTRHVVRLRKTKGTCRLQNKSQ